MIIGPADGFTPRIYQDECIHGNRRWLGILRCLHKYQKALAVLATGLGKTEIFLYLIRRYLESERTAPNKRALILAHRKELVGQPIARAHRFGLRLAREQGESTAVGAPERAIASTIQTMIKRYKLYRPDEIGLVVIDEAHHAAADDYKEVINYFAAAGAYILGFTATPHRLDGIALKEVFEAHAYSYPLLEATEDGWLVPIRAIRRVIDGLDLDKLRSRCGDLPPGALGELLAEHVLPVAKDIVDLAGDRPTIVFCPTVPHAYAQAEALRRYTDARVECAFSGTPKRKQKADGQQALLDGVVTREDMIDDFKSGAVQFLVNCELFCLDDRTEILTRAGWRGIDTLHERDAVAQWSPDGAIRFDVPQRVIRRDRLPEERMVSVDGPRMSIRVTDNHRMVYKSIKSAKWNVRPAARAAGRRWYLPVSGRAAVEAVDAPATPPRGDRQSRVRALSYVYRKAGVSPLEARQRAEDNIATRDSMTYKAPAQLTEAECWFIGFWIGDGSENHSPRGGIEYTLSQVAYHEEIVARVDATLAACGFDVIRRVRTRNGRTNVHWSLPRGTGFGPQARRGLFAIEPYLQKWGTDLWWGLNDRQFAAFMDGLWNADGNHAPDGSGYGHRHITSVEQGLVNLLQAIAACRGYSTYSVAIAPTCPRHRVKWRLRWTLKGEHQLVNDRLAVEDGWWPERVWCVTVDTGFIVTRRHGHVVVLGNCEGFDAPNARCIALVRPSESASLVTQMVGRGTRPLPDTVDLPELRDDPAGRVAAIAASNKPDVLVIHFTAKSAKHSLVGPVDALAGNLTTAERLALVNIPLIGELTVDEAIQAARVAAAEQAAREAAELAAHTATSYEIDPFHPVVAMGMKGLRDDPNEARASEKMAKFLARNGVENAAALSASTAKKLQGTIIVRDRLHLASINQSIALQRAGVPTVSTLKMSIIKASALMAELHQNRGVRPRRWDSDPLLGGQAKQPGPASNPASSA